MTKMINKDNKEILSAAMTEKIDRKTSTDDSYHEI
jgi:hypothetical protein